MIPLLIPYWAPKVVNVGPVPIDPWATLVLIGLVVGLEISRARGIKRGLEVPDIVDGAMFTVGMGFIVGHLMHVLAYNPDRLETDGVMALVRVWQGFSSTGGFIGAVIGSVLFWRVIRPRDYWAHADTIMFAFPFAWVFGRLGCFAAHDHIGRSSDFFLAVNFPLPTGPRHDLGLYEALWTVVISAVFFALDRKPRKGGFYIALWAFLYAPARFVLDFLRNEDLANADVRWAGLTPAQWGMILMFGAGAFLAFKLRGAPEAAGSSSAPASE